MVNCWNRPTPARWTKTPAAPPATQRFPLSSADAPITLPDGSPSEANRQPSPFGTVITSPARHGSPPPPASIPASAPPSPPPLTPPSTPPSLPAPMPASLPASLPASTPASTPASAATTRGGTTSFELPLLLLHATAPAIANTPTNRQLERMPLPPVHDASRRRASLPAHGEPGKSWEMPFTAVGRTTECLAVTSPPHRHFSSHTLAPLPTLVP